MRLDDERVADAGIVLAATLAARLAIEALQPTQTHPLSASGGFGS